MHCDRKESVHYMLEERPKKNDDYHLWRWLLFGRPGPPPFFYGGEPLPFPLHQLKKSMVVQLIAP